MDFSQTLTEYLEIPIVRDILVILLGLGIGVVVYFFIKIFVLKWLQRLTKKTVNKWDDVIFEKGVFSAIAMAIPGILMFRVVPHLVVIADPVNQLIKVWLVIAIALTFDRLLSSALNIYSKYPISQRIPIKGFLQILRLAIWIFTGTTIFSLLIGQSPWALLGGLGALSAVLILIFQDTILNFFSGVQLTLNDQVRVGDWLEAPKFGADGDVVEVALHYIKVRNWDRSMTTIPTHKLAQDAFANWRGMFEGGGRRIKRAIYIDQTSVRFLDQKLYDHLKKIQLLQDYLTEKSRDIEEHNKKYNTDDSMVNGRHLTNLGTFRAYLFAYLRANKDINQELSLMVRQLPPTANGLPLEIYAFTADVGWVNHEGAASDVFDHVLAIVSEFGLRVHQVPSGHDLQTLLASSKD